MDPYHLQDGLGNCMPMIQLPSQRYGEYKRDCGVCTTKNYLKIFDCCAMCGFPQSAGIPHMGFNGDCQLPGLLTSACLKHCSLYRKEVQFLCAK